MPTKETIIVMLRQMFSHLADELEEKLGRKVDLLTRDGLSDIRIPQIENTISETLEWKQMAALRDRLIHQSVI